MLQSEVTPGVAAIQNDGAVRPVTPWAWYVVSDAFDRAQSQSRYLVVYG
jgi:hypothetical protein